MQAQRGIKQEKEKEKRKKKRHEVACVIAI
jgi:hypothetical protein